MMGVEVSPLHLATAYYRDVQREDIAKGNIKPVSRSLRENISLLNPDYKWSEDTDVGGAADPCRVFESALKNGLCPYKLVEGKQVSANRLQKMSDVSNMNVNIRRAGIDPSILSQCPTPEATGAVLGDLKQLDALVRISSQLNTTNRTEFMGAYTADQCAGHIMHLPEQLTCGYAIKKPDNKLTGEIDMALENGNMPLLGLNQMTLYRVPGPRALNYHGLPISARRWNSIRKRCEYRFRNSNGPIPCLSYSPVVTCDDEEMKSGFGWISSDLIEASGTSSTTISRQGP